MDRKQLSFTGVICFWAVLIGFVAGSVSERRGWVPDFTANQRLYESVLASAREIHPDTLAWVKREGIRVSDGDRRITVFTDFQCPYCKEFHDTTVPALEEEGFYVEYRHFPLSIHPQASVRAQLAECVNRVSNPGARELIDSLFTMTAENDTTDLGILPTAGITYVDLADCETTVSADLENARLLHLGGTPAIMVENMIISGAVPAWALIKLYKENSYN